MKKFLCAIFAICVMLNIVGCKDEGNRGNGDDEKVALDSSMKARLEIVEAQIAYLPSDVKQKVKKMSPKCQVDMIESVYWNDKSIRDTFLKCNSHVMGELIMGCNGGSGITLSPNQIDLVNKTVGNDIHRAFNVRHISSLIIRGKAVDKSNGEVEKNYTDEQIVALCKMNSTYIKSFVEIPNIDKIKPEYYSAFANGKTRDLELIKYIVADELAKLGSAASCTRQDVEQALFVGFDLEKAGKSFFGINPHFQAAFAKLK